MNQEWLDNRFAGLSPANFGAGVHFRTISPLRPPSGFENVWSEVSSDEARGVDLNEHLFEQTLALIVIADPTVDNEYATLRNFVETLDELPEPPAAVIWLQHKPLPQLHLQSMEGDTNGDAVSELLALGLDGVVPWELLGFDLCVQVRSRISRRSSLTRLLEETTNSRRRQTQYADYLQKCIDSILWDHLRSRLCPCIPPVRVDIPAGLPIALGDVTIGRKLGRGMFGSVHILEKPPDVEASGPREVVKVMEKKHVKDFLDLSCMKRMIDVMHLLSSDKWQHPNITSLHKVYQTPTHICLRMEFGGDCNLYERLRRRDKPDGRHRPIPYKFIVLLVRQLLLAVAHLHTGPSVCHRDVKPENCIIQEDSHMIHLKLTDFDMAMVQGAQTVCRSACGTLPFTAPEVLLKSQYCGKKADMWSLGIVLFEILCGLHIIEQVLAVNEDTLRSVHAGQPNMSVAKKIHDAFRRPGAASEIFDMYVFPDLQELVQIMSPLISDLVTVSVDGRLNASNLAVRMRDLERETNR